MKIYINGKMVDEKKAAVSVFDRGFLYGDGLFETMRSYGGKVLALDRHLDRLYGGAGTLGMTIKPGKGGLKTALLRLLGKNRLKDAYIRIIVTRGKGSIGLAGSRVKGQAVIIITKKFTPYPAVLYKKGVSIRISALRRNEKSPAAGVKSLNYLDSILARMEAQAGGADDALLLNTNGDVAETAVSNIFAVKKKTIITPSIVSGALPGVTRDIVIELAGMAGVEAKARRVRPAELIKAREVFITNSLMEVMPVTKIDGKKVGTGRPGPVTRFLHRLYRSKIHDY